jgi:hypothetical protein
VKAIRELHEYTFGELSGPGPFVDGKRRPQDVERSHYVFRFADPAESECPACGAARTVDTQKRPTYPNRTGFRQDAATSSRSSEASRRGARIA